MNNIILAGLLVLLTSTLALAQDNSRKDYSNSYYSNEPKSNTLNGDGYKSYNRNNNPYDTPQTTYRGSQGTYKNSEGRNTQINDNGLIINRE